MHDPIPMQRPGQATPERQEADSWWPGAGGGRGARANGSRVSFWGDGNVLELDGGVAQRCECTKSQGRPPLEGRVLGSVDYTPLRAVWEPRGGPGGSSQQPELRTPCSRGSAGEPEASQQEVNRTALPRTSEPPPPPSALISDGTKWHRAAHSLRRPGTCAGDVTRWAYKPGV